MNIISILFKKGFDVITGFIFRTEMNRLTNLLNKIFSGQAIETSDLDENTFEIIQENQPNRQEIKHIHGKDLPKKVISNILSL